ncbi:hypothetical protein NMG60_11008447 [Bertholletia excelsa]
MEFESFIHMKHGHQLVLAEESPGKTNVCLFCREEISGLHYQCTASKIVVHKSCGELPVELMHPLHPHLLAPISTISRLKVIGCSICNLVSEGLTYHCAVCDFNVDRDCAVTVLNLRKRLSEFSCDACGFSHKGSFYLCAEPNCGLTVVKKCTELPRTIQHNTHPCPLSLTDFLSFQNFKFISFCDICKRKMKREHSAYHCAKCRFFAHLPCALSPSFHSNGGRETETELQLHDENLITLPLSDSSVNPVMLFIESISPADKYEGARHVKHPSHPHALTPFNGYSRGAPIKLDDIIKNGTKCELCALPISFFLHKCCAELPDELLHPAQANEPLRLMNKLSEDRDYDQPFYVYWGGSWAMHIRCASLPQIVKHEAHEHPLTLVGRVPSVPFKDREEFSSAKHCSTCFVFNPGLSFICSKCRFRMCAKCAFLPHEVKHRYDKHLLALTYSPRDLTEIEFYCEACEKEIDPKFWFYYCKLCDQAIHPTCIFPLDWYSRERFGDTLKVKWHEHLLTLVQLPSSTKKRDCKFCSKIIKDVAYECMQCDFSIHRQSDN